MCGDNGVYAAPYPTHTVYAPPCVQAFFAQWIWGASALRYVQYANRYGKCIDWAEVARCCAQCRAQKFAAALLALGEKWLGVEPDRAGHPERALQCEKDGADLLQDLLDSGAYGDSSMSRRHSGTLTLETVRSEKRGLVRTLFPPISAMRQKYVWLKQRPICFGRRGGCAVPDICRKSGATEKKMESERAWPLPAREKRS